MKKMRAMRMTTAGPFLICLALMSCQTEGQGTDTQPPEEDAALMGSWLLLQINRGGEDIDLDHLEGAIREIGERTYSITPMKGTTITGKYTIDPEARPRTIEMLVDNGRFEGETLKGIYRVKGDRLTISFGGPDQDRPEAFESRPGTQFTVAIHKKVE